jgi:hypothetical protein
MYLTFTLLLSFCCVTHLCSNKSIQLPQTKIMLNWEILHNFGVFVIARPLYKNTINFSSVRPKQSIIIQQPQTN